MCRSPGGTLTPIERERPIGEHSGDEGLQRLGQTHAFGRQFLQLLRDAGWDVGEYTPLAGASRYAVSAVSPLGYEVHRWGDDFSEIALDVFSECARLQQVQLTTTQLSLL